MGKGGEEKRRWEGIKQEGKGVLRMKVPVVSWGDWKAHNVQVRPPGDRECGFGEKAGMEADGTASHTVITYDAGSSRDPKKRNRTRER